MTEKETSVRAKELLDEWAKSVKYEDLEEMAAEGYRECATPQERNLNLFGYAKLQQFAEFCVQQEADAVQVAVQKERERIVIEVIEKIIMEYLKHQEEMYEETKAIRYADSSGMLYKLKEEIKERVFGKERENDTKLICKNCKHVLFFVDPLITGRKGVVEHLNRISHNVNCDCRIPEKENDKK